MSAVRIAWFVTAVVLASSAYLIQTKYERAIERSKATIELLYRQTVADERTIANATLLRASQDSAERDLAGVSRDASASLATASLLAMLHDAAITYRTVVRDIEPGRTVAEGPLQATDLTLRIQGSFHDVIRFIAAVSQQNEPIRVSHTELALTSQAGASPHKPQLDATIHATLYRIAPEIGLGDKHVASTR